MMTMLRKFSQCQEGHKVKKEREMEPEGYYAAMRLHLDWLNGWKERKINAGPPLWDMTVNVLLLNHPKKMCQTNALMDISIFHWLSSKKVIQWTQLFFSRDWSPKKSASCNFKVHGTDFSSGSRSSTQFPGLPEMQVLAKGLDDLSAPLWKRSL